MPESKLFIVPKEPAQHRQIPSNLPTQPAPLIGRERELEEVKHLLNAATAQEPSVRLLTLTGPGGVGKTRLALQAAEEALAEFEDGVFLVELATILDPDLVIPAIATILQLREQPGNPLVSTLIENLQKKRMLLVLDNFEQVIQARGSVAELLAGCPTLKLMVTSRTALRLRAERELAISPLSLPDPRQHPSVATLAQYGAVALFVQRAHMVESDFALTNDNAAAVLEVCRKVDGLPLAIELVAAHSKLLSPQSIVARLTNPLRLLTGGSHDALGRHKTMRAAIEWSYNLLTEEEAILFRRLSVFVGGFSLRAAEVICNEGGEAAIEADHPLAIEVLEGIEALVDKSLVRRSEQREGGDRRLEMLETVREYAEEQMVANGEAEPLRRQHAHYYVALAQEFEPHLDGPEMEMWFDRLNPEQANLRAALRWLLDQKDPGAADDALQLIVSLFSFWDHRAHASETRTWLDRTLAQAGPQPTELQVNALRLSTSLAADQGDLAGARAAAERGLEIAYALGDAPTITRILNSVAVVAYMQADYKTAKSLLEECLARSRAVGDDVRAMAALQNLGEVARFQGNHELAVEFCKESLEGFKAIGKKIGVLTALESLGFSEYHLGRFREARATLLEGLELAYGMGSKMHVAVFLAGLSGAALAELDRPPDRGHMFHSWAKAEEVRQVARFLGVSAKLLESVGRQLEPLEQAEFERNVAMARQWLGEEAFAATWEEGQALTLEQAFELVTRSYAEDEIATIQPRGRGRPRKRAAGGLTDREFDVALLVARGMTNSDIASQLVLSVRTIETHVSNAMQKLGLHTRTELATWAVRRGVPPDTAQD